MRRPADGAPFGLSIGASIEGQNNLHLDPQPGVSATFSRLHGTWLALYANPTYVHNAHTPTLRLAHEGHSPGGSTADRGVEIKGENLFTYDNKFILAGADVKMRLASVYTTLGWDHHRATVVETW